MKGLQSSLQRSEGIPYVKVQQSAIWGTLPDVFRLCLPSGQGSRKKEKARSRNPTLKG